MNKDVTNDAEITTADKIMFDLFLTKSTACLVCLIDTGVPADKFRTDAIAELRELRAMCKKKEEELLHAVVLKHVKSALAKKA